MAKDDDRLGLYPNDGTVLEKHIQEDLSKNLHRLGLGNLTLVGLEHPVSFGRIDILAEAENGTLVVVEVKRGVASRDAIGQVQSYMGALMQQHTDRNIIGVIVAQEMDDSGHAAINAHPQIYFCQYRLNFSFHADSTKGRSALSSSGIQRTNQTPSMSSLTPKKKSAGESDWLSQGASISDYTVMCKTCGTRTKPAKLEGQTYCMNCSFPLRF